MASKRDSGSFLFSVLSYFLSPVFPPALGTACSARNHSARTPSLGLIGGGEPVACMPPWAVCITESSGNFAITDVDYFV